MASHRGLIVLGASGAKRRGRLTARRAHAVATQIDFASVTPVLDTGEDVASFLVAPLSNASLGRPALDRYVAWLEESGIAFIEFAFELGASRVRGGSASIHLPAARI